MHEAMTVHYESKTMINLVLCICLCYLLSRVRLFATPWTVARQAPLSKGFSRQGNWSGLPFPPPGDPSWPRDRTWVSCTGRRILSHQDSPVDLCIWSPLKHKAVWAQNSPRLLCLSHSYLIGKQFLKLPLLNLLPHSSVGKESIFNGGDPGSIPGSGRSTGEGIGYPLQYSWASLVAQLVKN